MSASSDPLAAELARLIGTDRVRTDPVELDLFRQDASTFDQGAAGIVCVPENADEVRLIVAACAEERRPFVARGAGTWLAGGAVPCGDRPVVISMTKMDRIVEVNPAGRYAWLEPGVINLDLSIALRPYGLHFAPDPSSQAASTIGGNVSNNAVGPHCLAYGVTNAHVLALDLVLPSGEPARIGHLSNEPRGYDLRGVVVGAEGMFGVVTRVAVRLTPNPRRVVTILASFSSVSDAASAVGAVISSGIVPAAMEMLDRNAVALVEDFIQAGYPRDAEGVLLVELDGEPGACEADAVVVEGVCQGSGAAQVRRAVDDAERELLWKGRKAAFGAVARIQPDYYLHDTVVPRLRLVVVLERIYEIAERYELTMLNVFHAGDGNLHPIIAYDARVPGLVDRVHAAGREIIEVALDNGGALSGEHGIGLEKIDYMGLMFSAAVLDVQARLRSVFDPEGIANPMKVIPSGASCGHVSHLDGAPAGTWV